VTVVERSPLKAKGLAYGTNQAVHLLNVAAENMSAFPEDPGHFLRWAKEHIGGLVHSRSYLPRREYGKYLESLLNDAFETYGKQLNWIQGDAVAIRTSDECTLVYLGDGQTISTDRVILAQGNFLCSDPPLPGKSSDCPRYVASAWLPSTLEGLSSDDSILLVGSGLTSLDMAMALRARQHRGPIHLLSRHGLLPQRHRACSPWNVSALLAALPLTARGILTAIRKEARAAEAQGSDWRAVMNSLRPYTQEIWHALPHSEKTRFLRHLRPYWEVHRHRVAAEIGKNVAAQLATEKICVHAGRISSFKEEENAIYICYSDRRSGEIKRIQAQRVINCTAPETDYRKLKDPLVVDLLSSKQARPDSLSLGLDVSQDGALIASDGEPSNVLFAVGPARKGQLWETTAVPEIRQQVAQLADHLFHSGVEQTQLRSPAQYSQVR
jgi:uncharacterized NAD(P)/FAD-binding protein YdhS